MKRKVTRMLSLVLCAVLCCGLLTAGSLAAGRNYDLEESLAEDLKEMGLFQGVSEDDFDLDRVPTRTEALVMLVRLLGKEDMALTGNWNHPFTDVAEWADKYVGYAYAAGLTKGTSDTTFGTGNADAAMYLTFVLRALGYTDGEKGDFTWDSPYELAKKLGIVPEETDLKNFLRADVVLVSYAALNTDLKNSKRSLADQIWADSANGKQVFYRSYDHNAFRDHLDPFEAISEYLEENGLYDKTEDCYYVKSDITVAYYPYEDSIVLGYNSSNYGLNFLGTRAVYMVIEEDYGWFDEFEYDYYGKASTGLEVEGVIYAEAYTGYYTDMSFRTIEVVSEGEGSSQNYISVQQFQYDLINLINGLRSFLIDCDIQTGMEDLGFTSIEQ